MWSQITAFSTPPINSPLIQTPYLPIVLTATPLSLSILVGGEGGWCCYLGPLTHLWLHCLFPSWWGGGGWSCDQVQLAHPRLRHGFHSVREIQLTPQIPTKISSVGSLATAFADNNILCTSKQNPKQSISPLQFNRADSYLVFNYDYCGVTTTTGTS